MKQSAIFCVTALLAAALCACSNSGETDITTDNVTSAAHTEAADVGTADIRDMHGVPVDTLDFGGKTFRSMTYDGSNFSYYFFADDETGDVMNDAIYARRRNVEEALNVVLQHELKLDFTEAQNRCAPQYRQTMMPTIRYFCTVLTVYLRAHRQDIFTIWTSFPISIWRPTGGTENRWMLCGWEAIPILRSTII